MEKVVNFYENNGEDILTINKDVIKNTISCLDAELDFENSYSDETSAIAFVKFIKEAFPKLIALHLKTNKDNPLELKNIYEIKARAYQNKQYLAFEEFVNKSNVFVLPALLSFEEARRVVEDINTFLMDYNIGRILIDEKGTSLIIDCTLQDIKNAYYMELQRLEYLTNPQQTKYDR